MQVVYERCCGLDVHKQTVVACVLTPGPDGQTHKAIRTYGTMTAELLELADWLASEGVTHVAMESTGSYWKPIWNLLEGRFTLLLVNARHIKAVPGRKTDVKDCEWLAELLQHGLLRPSFVPDRPQRELRELVRYRTALIQERSAELNRVQKTLEGANIKLAAVASEIRGKSSRQMLEALVAGTTAAKTLAELARGRMKAKRPQLEQALVGRIGPHQRFLLAQQLAHLDFLDGQLAQVSAEIEARLRPFEPTLARLQSIPGVGRRIAETVLVEVGPEVSRFPTAGQLASWAGMCPGNHASAGKRKTGRTRPGNAALRSALVEAAHAASRTKGSYLAAQYHRLAHRRGKKRAAVAVGHTLLVIIYHLLQRQTTYQELGAHYFDERDRQVLERRLVQRLKALGYEVTLQPAEPAA